MAEIVYLLCFIMSVACSLLLFRSYRKSFSPLLLWSTLFFAFLAINNAILVVDLVIIPNVEFDGPLWRNLAGAAAGLLMLFGLIWEVT
jgi:hypothetical protein